jgi:hypothetical protein
MGFETVSRRLLIGAGAALAAAPSWAAGAHEPGAGITPAAALSKLLAGNAR